MVCAIFQEKQGNEGLLNDSTNTNILTCVYIEADASQKGIGAVMLQPDKNNKNTSNT